MDLTFGDKMIVLRKRKKIPRVLLAKKIGVSPASITNYENDVYKPSYKVLVRISDYFEVTTDFLLK
ncbi:MAG: helix-turn-helix transcriptional regulator [Candidatus Margulisbacteria bacterium]|nr:helix-turn-helix transcriptional regulator [Candidatus Margulisiibacteriota bacterium]